MFVHASIAHIVGNMLFFFIFGLRGEEMFSLPEYLGIYIGGGLAGNLLSLVWGPNLLSVGASGAIFALFGAIVIFARRSVRQSILGSVSLRVLFVFYQRVKSRREHFRAFGRLRFWFAYWLFACYKA